MKNIKRLNIGCGLSKIDGSEWCNLDISSECNPDLVHDIRKGLPMFMDGQLDEVIANGVLEQLTHEQFRDALNEIWRVTNKNGQLNGQMPSIDLRVLHYDPMDKLFFQKESFRYFTFGDHAYKQFGVQYDFRPWDIIKLEINDNGILCFSMSPHK